MAGEDAVEADMPWLDRLAVPSVVNTASGDVGGSLFQAQTISGGVHLHQHTPEQVTLAVARTLPHDAVHFTGRYVEIRQLQDAVMRDAEGAAIGIHTIDGMPGIGKTALAVHVAHRTVGQFPDGQLFLRLHAHTAGQSPITPEDALSALLGFVGVDPRAIPDTLDQRSALWRDRAAGRKLLLVLDDAVGHEQIRPLLPGAPGCCVVITSRRRLAALYGATVMSLDALPPGEAAELFTRMAGIENANTDDVFALVEMAGYLPLAIQLLGSRLRHHRSWSVADLRNELASASNRSAAIRAEGVAVDAAFDLSYNALSDDLERLFVTIGALPLVDFDAHVMAAVLRSDVDEVHRDLEALYDTHLIEEPVRGRFTMHDLIRQYARYLFGAENRERMALTITRLLDYYFDAVTDATTLLRIGSTKQMGHRFSTRPEAVEWLDTELPNLTATITEYAGSNSGVAVARLAHALNSYLARNGHWRVALLVHQSGHAAARSGGERAAEAKSLRDLGDVQRLLGQYEPAKISFTEALALHDQLDDEPGRADILRYLGVIERMVGNYDAALNWCDQALALFRRVHDEHEIARVLTLIATIRNFMSNPAAALAVIEEALILHQRIDDDAHKSTILRELGQAQRLGGDPVAAEASLIEALELSRKTGYRVGEADVIYNLGALRRDLGYFDHSRVLLVEALDIYRNLGNLRGQAVTLNELGILARERDATVAFGHHEEALRLAKITGGLREQGQARAGLGLCLVDLGDRAGALANLAFARWIFRKMGIVEAGEVADKIAILESGNHGN